MASAIFEKASREEQDLYWANIWFKLLAKFHSKAADPAWKFTTQEVIAFLRYKRDAKAPAWKRVKILQALLVYRRMIQGQSIDEFLWIRDKLREVAQFERAQREGFDTIEEAVGSIDPNEPDVIQAFRSALRKDGKALKTERSYVGKLKAFMADRGLKCLSDFAGDRGVTTWRPI